jgi:hypothetical protein
MGKAFNKMIVAAGINFERSWALWKMYVLNADRNRMKLAKRNLAA